MRPPSCEVCDADVGATSERLLTFVRPTSSAGEAEAGADLAVGHPDHQGWFCDAHHEAALTLTGSHTLADAVQVVRDGDMARMPDSSSADSEPVEPTWEAVALSLRTALPALAAELGLAAVPPTVESTREWTPMDGTEPPWCPYIDRETTVIERDGAAVRLIVERAHWSDDELARADVILTVDAPGVAARVSVARGPGEGALENLRGLESLPERAQQLVRDALVATERAVEGA